MVCSSTVLKAISSIKFDDLTVDLFGKSTIRFLVEGFLYVCGNDRRQNDGRTSLKSFYSKKLIVSLFTSRLQIQSSSVEKSVLLFIQLSSNLKMK